MPGRRARLAGYLTAATLLTLVLTAPAEAADQSSRIVNGQPASAGEYPAQGFLQVNVTSFCGGTLVGPRRFLTAAHCAVNDTTGLPLPPSAFRVTLGELNRDQFGNEDHWLVSMVEVNPQHSSPSPGQEHFDAAMLTLDRPAPFAPLPIITANRTSAWGPGVPATIIGWGTTTAGGFTSNALLDATVPMVSDAQCLSDYDPGPGPSDFDPASMVCAGNGTGDTCQGDSGGPLMVNDQGLRVLAGITSWGQGCNDPAFPGIYSRIGAEPLNGWAFEHTLDFSVGAAPQTNTPTSFAATTAHPSGAAFLPSYRWDFEGDGTFDATGASAAHTYTAPGVYTAVLEGSRPGNPPVTTRQTFNVVPGPPVIEPEPTPIPTPTPTPTPSPQLATLIAGRSATVDRLGRFGVRVNFAEDAPAGRNAVLDVFRLGRLVGSARVRVRPGESVRVKVKLTKAAFARLSRSVSRRQTVKLRLRLGRTVRRRTLVLRSPKPEPAAVPAQRIGR